MDGEGGGVAGEEVVEKLWGYRFLSFFLGIGFSERSHDVCDELVCLVLYDVMCLGPGWSWS